MGLFSMLFGAGAILYAAKSTETGKAPRALWFRRMFWLLVIGLAHAYLIWDGDILVPYALCGLLLLWWVRRLPAWALTAGAVGLLAVGALLSLGHGDWESMSEAERAHEAEIWMPTPEQTAAQLAYMLGSYPQVVAHRATFVLMFQTFFFAFFFFWRCGGMMLLGMALYKSGFLDGRRPARDYVLVAAICIPLGLALAWYGPLSSSVCVSHAAAHHCRSLELHRLGVRLRRLCGGADPGRKARRTGGLRKALAAVGQMAFTNYLLQSVITSVLFLGWGFGLAGRFDYARAVDCRRRDLGVPARPESGVARPLSLRPGRVALAIAHVLARPADERDARAPSQRGGVAAGV